MDLTCIHADKGLCPACRADFEADPAAFYEYGDHPAGLARWRETLEEMARDAAADAAAVGAPPAADNDIPF